MAIFAWGVLSYINSYGIFKNKDMSILIKISVIFFSTLHILCLANKPGELPVWETGMLDIHFINTGAGNCIFSILPDGTTLLIDAGEQDPTSPRVLSPRNTPRYPNYSNLGYQWQADYILSMLSDKKPEIDYALITHFHSDHYGGMYPGIAKSETGNYYLSGITGVGDIIPVKVLIDRGWYYPVDLKAHAVSNRERFSSLLNYWDFVTHHQNKNDLQYQQFEVGANNQFSLVHAPEKYQNFSIRNINANGIVWNGDNHSKFISRMPDTSTVIATGNIPGENALSCGILMEYGPFRFYTGGDIQGKQPDFMNKPEWFDMESLVGPVVGEVDVTTANHHANRDAMSENYLAILKPRVIIQEVWSSDHPGHEALLRMTSKKIWEEERDLFATNMLESNRLVIGNLIDESYRSMHGHIVLRVMPGGKDYYIYILNHQDEERKVKSVFGPYLSKK